MKFREISLHSDLVYPAISHMYLEIFINRSSRLSVWYLLFYSFPVFSLKKNLPQNVCDVRIDYRKSTWLYAL